MGRRPVPTELRADSRVHRATRGVARARRGEPPMPTSIAMDSARVAIWRYVCDELREMNILASSDSGILTSYTMSAYTLEMVTQLLDAQVEALGAAVAYAPDSKVAGGGSRNHLLAEQRAARQDVAKFASMLGLTPTSRGNLRTLGDEGEGKSAADAYM